KLIEAKETVGGGMRTIELTEPGFHHDVCSAVHPLGADSPFFRTFPLDAHGLKWIYPPVDLAHPFDDGHAAVLERSIETSAARLGAYADAYRDLFTPIANNWSLLASDILGPLRFPKNPRILTRFGINALQPATTLARRQFRGSDARGLF